MVSLQSGHTGRVIAVHWNSVANASVPDNELTQKSRARAVGTDSADLGAEVEHPSQDSL